MKRFSGWLAVLVLAALALPLSLALGSSGPAPTGRIAFVLDPLCRNGTRPAADCGKGEVAVVAADGSQLRVLTHDTVTENDPVWSPNGQEIAFIRPKPHTSDQIWVMNADGTNQHALTRFRTAPQLFGGYLEPALSWSPDGQEIVISAYPTSQGGREQLYLLDVRTRQVTRLTHLASGATNPVWSPDGRSIAFVGTVAPGRVFLLSPRTRHVRALSSRGGAPVTALGIAWSPDSRRLAFNATGKLEVFDLRSRLFRTLAAAGNSPSWAPDGNWVVFCSGDYVKEVRADGTGLHPILHFNSQKRRDFAPDWGPG